MGKQVENKTIFIKILLLLFAGCTQEVKILSKPDGARFTYNGTEFTTPAVIPFKNKENVILAKYHYEDLPLEITEKQTIQVVLKERLYNVSITTTPEDAEVYMDGSLISGEQQLPEGKYQLKIKREGYTAANKRLHVIGNTSKKYKLEPLYRFINLPYDLFEITHKGRKVTPEYRYGTHITGTNLKLSRGQTNYTIKITPEMIVNTYQVDIGTEHYSIPDEVNNSTGDFTIMGEGIIPLKTAQRIPKVFMYYIGYGEDFHADGDYKENALYLQKPFTPDISIINPTVELIGSTLIIEAGTEIRRIEITEEYYNQQTEKGKNGYSYYKHFGPDGKKYLFPIMDLDFSPPYNGMTCIITLKKGNQVLESAEIKGSELFDSQNHTGIYSRKRDSFFYDETEEQSNRFFLYIHPEETGKFLVIYEMGPKAFIPVYVCRAGEASDFPAVITRQPGSKKEYRVITTENLWTVDSSDLFFAGRF